MKWPCMHQQGLIITGVKRCVSWLHSVDYLLQRMLWRLASNSPSGTRPWHPVREWLGRLQALNGYCSHSPSFASAPPVSCPTMIVEDFRWPWDLVRHCVCSPYRYPDLRGHYCPKSRSFAKDGEANYKSTTAVQIEVMLDDADLSVMMPSTAP